MDSHAFGCADIVVTKAMRGGEHPMMSEHDTGAILTRAEDINDALLSKLELGTDFCPSQTIGCAFLGRIVRCVD
jgi:hypothetical protein